MTHQHSVPVTVKCSTCNGAGLVVTNPDRSPGSEPAYARCSTCNGTGQVPAGAQLCLFEPEHYQLTLCPSR